MDVDLGALVGVQGVSDQRAGADEWQVGRVGDTRR